MFIILKNENAQQIIIGVTESLELAAQKMIEHAIKLGAIDEDNSTNAGVYITHNSDGSITVYKNIVNVTRGYIYGETRDVVQDQIATYTAVELPKLVEHEITTSSTSHIAAEARLSNELSRFILTPMTTVDDIKNKYKQLANTDRMTYGEALGIGGAIRKSTESEKAELLSWCAVTNKDSKTHHITNLVGLIHNICGRKEEAAASFVVAAEEGDDFAFRNLCWNHPNEAGIVATKLSKKIVERLQNAPMTANESIINEYIRYMPTDEIDNLTKWCTENNDAFGNIYYLLGTIYRSRYHKITEAAEYYKLAIAKGFSFFKLGS